MNKEDKIKENVKVFARFRPSEGNDDHITADYHHNRLEGKTQFLKKCEEILRSENSSLAEFSRALRTANPMYTMP